MEGVRIEVLGEFRAFGPDGRPIALPASRKTKALLAYLALTGRAHLREHLCDLLWDGPDDPRGALRWSLSRIRAGLDSKTSRCVEADRRSIGLVAGAYTLDLHEAQRAIELTVGAPSIETLRRAEGLYRGGLLEGLDLLDSFRFHSWCVGQREVARSARLKILAALIEQAPETQEALKYAHALVSIDPLNEAAHTQVIRLLLQMQRNTDAQEQADSYRRTLEIELGEVPPEVAARLRKILHSEPPAPRSVPGKRERAPAVEALPLVGRADEVATLTSWLQDSGTAEPMAVISGEPGAGKTRLMNEVIGDLGPCVLVIRGRAYRAENARAFGPWRDAVAEIEGAASVLTSVTDTGAEPQQRSQLFEELLALITAQAALADQLVIALDDLQWLDEASVAFAHFLVRGRREHVKLLGTVRTEEIIDNQPLGDVFESLRKESSVAEVRARPLTKPEVARICAAIGDRVDADEVFARSEGNPFLATELARALARGETELPGDMRHLVEARLRTLSEPARELLPWAAALGRTFHIDVLERVTRLGPIELVERVGELEERGVFEPRETGAYDFVHDLVRDAAYGELSAPRQRIVHRSIARSLDSWDEGGAEFNPTELLRHAELGGEAAIACRSGVAAAQDALDVCAWVDACTAADRGLQHTSVLDPRAQVATTLRLLSCRITAGSILARRHPDHVGSAVANAVKLSTTPQQRAHALYLQAVLQFDNGQTDHAERGLLEMASAGRKGDPETAARQIANSARCLLQIEGPAPMARSMLGEARETLGAMGLEDVELYWAEALLARWDGDLKRSAEQLVHAIRLATETGKQWRSSSCLTALIMVTSEAGDADRVELLTRGGAVPGENSDPLKSPFVEGLAGLADFQRDRSSTQRLDRANDVLRKRGANAQLSYLLAESARLHADVGNLDEASAAAREAVRLGELVRRVVPQTDALVTLASVSLERGDLPAARDALAQAQGLAESGKLVTARVASRLSAVADRLT